MGTATTTDTEVLEQIHNQESLPCQIMTAILSTETFKILETGVQCENPAEYTTLLHDPPSHRDTHTDMCGDCYRDFIGKTCLDPSCGKPRLTQVRPI